MKKWTVREGQSAVVVKTASWLDNTTQAVFNGTVTKLHKDDSFIIDSAANCKRFTDYGTGWGKGGRLYVAFVGTTDECAQVVEIVKGGESINKAIAIVEHARLAAHLVKVWQLFEPSWLNRTEIGPNLWFVRHNEAELFVKLDQKYTDWYSLRIVGFSGASQIDAVRVSGKIGEGGLMGTLMLMLDDNQFDNLWQDIYMEREDASN